jgi:[ribosomal protein S5]-alanine N-acetyltransferase
VLELQRLRLNHEQAVYDFERSNREYFAMSVSDRGDDFFENFSKHYRELLAEQDTGKFAFYLLLQDDVSILGRFNLYDIDGETAVVGYRVADHVSGRGVATDGLRDLCRIARDDGAVRTLRAVVKLENVASKRVLEKAGFIAVGPATVADRDGIQYELDLSARSSVRRMDY